MRALLQKGVIPHVRDTMKGTVAGACTVTATVTVCVVIPRLYERQKLSTWSATTRSLMHAI